MKLEIHSLTEVEERQILQDQFTQMLAIFTRELYSGERPEVCRITYEAFGNLEDAHHNCIGCNLLESTDLIHQYLQMNQSPFSLHQAYTTYTMLAYLLVERLDTMLDLIKLPDFYRENHFKVLDRIRRWANFIKHPKGDCSINTGQWVPRASFAQRSPAKEQSRLDIAALCNVTVAIHPRNKSRSRRVGHAVWPALSQSGILAEQLFSHFYYR